MLDIHDTWRGLLGAKNGKERGESAHNLFIAVHDIMSKPNHDSRNEIYNFIAEADQVMLLTILLQTFAMLGCTRGKKEKQDSTGDSMRDFMKILFRDMPEHLKDMLRQQGLDPDST